MEYQDNKLALAMHAEGRIVFPSEGPEYQYDLSDHLGNTRLTFSEKPMVSSQMASMERSAAPVEETLFEGLAESRQTLIFHNTTDASITEPEPSQVATLLPGEMGPSSSRAVRQGDKIKLKVKARYETAPPAAPGIEGVATEIAGALEKTASGLESSGASESLNGVALTGAVANGEEPTVPMAYMNYLLYDEDYQLVDQGFQQVSEQAAVGKSNPNAKAETLSLEVDITQNGYLYTYLSYEAPGSLAASNTNARTASSSGGSDKVGLPANGPVANNGVPVHFDDFIVEHEGISIVQHNDRAAIRYYAFGAPFEQRSVAGLRNKYLYQGKEYQSELNLSLYDFHARQYDPLLGRFTSLDPASQFASGYVGMGNNPVGMIDPDGEFAFALAPVIASMAAGAKFGAIAGAASYGFNWLHTGQGDVSGLIQASFFSAVQFGVSAGVGNAFSQVGTQLLGASSGLGAGLANLGFQAASTTASSIAGNLATGKDAFSSLNIGAGPFMLPFRDGKLSSNPIDHIHNIHTLYVHARGFTDVLAGNADVKFSKTHMAFAFREKIGKEGYVSKMLTKMNSVTGKLDKALGREHGGAMFIQNITDEPAMFQPLNFSRNDFAAQISPHGVTAFEEGVHILQQRFRGPITFNYFFPMGQFENYQTRPWEVQAKSLTQKYFIKNWNPSKGYFLWR